MKKTVKLLAAVLAAIMAACSCPVVPQAAESAYDPPLRIGVMSDIHFFPEEYTNLNSPQFLQDNHCDSKLMGESEAVLKATLGTMAARKANGSFPMNCLIIPGDLTFDGEKLGHTKVAAYLKQFEEETGVDVFVINGNHDINNYEAACYATPDNKKMTAKDDPGMLLTTPGDFRNMYADLGFDKADGFYIPAEGKAGGLSYTAALPGGYRLIAIDSCVYTADVTEDGQNEKESRMNITPGLLDWVIDETAKAKRRGETVIGMAHGSIIEHFELEEFLSGNAMVADHERVSYELADAGMHFIFTGHMHSNDTVSIVSADNEILYDIETCGLTNIPNTYNEASFAKGLLAEHTELRLNSVDCDAECLVDVSRVSKYGVIDRPFRENYNMPVVYGGSIEDGIRNDGAKYFDNAFLMRIPPAIKKALPDGLGGLLRDNGIDLGITAVSASPELKSALRSYGLSTSDFSGFLGALVQQIDNTYILDTTRTTQLVSAVIARFARYEIAEGNAATAFGKIALLAVEYNARGNENIVDNPEIQQAIDALRTQEGADRIIAELLDIVINDVLFDILYSISLEDLNGLLSAGLMEKLRAAAGGELTAGALLDKILDTAAESMNRRPFVRIENGRDLVKALVYTAGYQYLNAGTRLKISETLADIIVSFTVDENPAFCGDTDTTLRVTGKADVEPTVENYRLPADLSVSAGSVPGEVVITWYTIQGIEASDLELSPLPPGASVAATADRAEKELTVIDLGFMQLTKARVLLKHSVTVTGLGTGTDYTFLAGDSHRGLLSESRVFSVDENGGITNGEASTGEGGFFGFLMKVVEFVLSLRTILLFFI